MEKITDIIALVETVKSDLLDLAEERRAAASNEHIWGLGSEDETSTMHFDNEIVNRIAANFFEAIAKPEIIIALLEEYAEV